MLEPKKNSCHQGWPHGPGCSILMYKSRVWRPLGYPGAPEAIYIDHRLRKQQYTTLFLFNGWYKLSSQYLIQLLGNLAIQQVSYPLRQLWMSLCRSYRVTTWDIWWATKQVTYGWIWRGSANLVSWRTSCMACQQKTFSNAIFNYKDLKSATHLWKICYCESKCIVIIAWVGRPRIQLIRVQILHFSNS